MEPIIGEIAIFPYGKTPEGWAQCNGQLMTIRDNQALYTLIGTFYGGDGKTTFALPDLRGRVPAANTYGMQPGVNCGVEEVTLTSDTTPTHNHMVQALNLPGNQFLGAAHNIAGTNPGVTGDPAPLYAPDDAKPLTGLNADAVAVTGEGAAHPNMQPYLVLNFCIATTGAYPMRP